EAEGGVEARERLPEPPRLREGAGPVQVRDVERGARRDRGVDRGDGVRGAARRPEDLPTREVVPGLGRGRRLEDPQGIVQPARAGEGLGEGPPDGGPRAELEGALERGDRLRAAPG